MTSALMLAAGLEGIRDRLDPGDPIEDLTYDWKAGPPGAIRLPRNLQEAIDAFAEDSLVHEVFPAPFVREYSEMKQLEWDEYHAQVSDWERSRYLLNL